MGRATDLVISLLPTLHRNGCSRDAWLRAVLLCMEFVALAWSRSDDGFFSLIAFCASQPRRHNITVPRQEATRKMLCAQGDPMTDEAKLNQKSQCTNALESSNFFHGTDLKTVTGTHVPWRSQQPRLLSASASQQGLPDASHCLTRLPWQAPCSASGWCYCC